MHMKMEEYKMGLRDTANVSVRHKYKIVPSFGSLLPYRNSTVLFCVYLLWLGFPEPYNEPHYMVYFLYNL